MSRLPSSLRSRNEIQMKRSSPTTWVGQIVKVIGTRAYYSACKYENEIYRVWDAVFLNADSEPYPIGRIVAMWEQAKKKWLTINWFYRASDIEKSIEDKQRLEGRSEDYEEEKGKGIVRKKLDTPDEEILRETLEYINQLEPQEILSSSQKDDNYPSTLLKKISVKHIDEISNFEEYIKDKKSHFFYKKQIDLNTFKLTSAKPSHPTVFEAIDYDPKQIRSRRTTTSKVPRNVSLPRKRKARIDYVDDYTSSPSPPQMPIAKRQITHSPSPIKKQRITDSQSTISHLKKSLGEEKPKNEESQYFGTISGALEKHLTHLQKTTEDSLNFLEQFLKDQQEQIIARLQLVENLVTRSNQISVDIYSQIDSAPHLVNSLKIYNKNHESNPFSGDAQRKGTHDNQNVLLPENSIEEEGEGFSDIEGEDHDDGEEEDIEDDDDVEGVDIDEKSGD